MRVGFIGLGVMGSEMAGHLAAGGHRLTVYDLDAAAIERVVQRFPGIAGAATPRAVAAASEVVVCMLPNGEVVRSVLFDAHGAAAGLAPGTVLLDTSSAEPWLTRESAARLAAQGVALVDAGVSGAFEGAANATLVFMVGGDDGDVARCRPLLEQMGRTIFHLGPVGAGHAMKSVNNLATALTFLGTAEALLIGRAHGLDTAQMVAVMNVSTAASFVTRKPLTDHVVPRNFADPFKLGLMSKDVGIANRLAREAGLPVPVSALGQQLWAAADVQLGPGCSVTDIVRWYEALTGLCLGEDPESGAAPD